MLRSRIQERLGLSDEEFKSWKLAVLDANIAHDIADGMFLIVM